MTVGLRESYPAKFGMLLPCQPTRWKSTGLPRSSRRVCITPFSVTFESRLSHEAYSLIPQRMQYGNRTHLPLVICARSSARMTFCCTRLTTVRHSRQEAVKGRSAANRSPGTRTPTREALLDRLFHLPCQPTERVPLEMPSVHLLRKHDNG